MQKFSKYPNSLSDLKTLTGRQVFLGMKVKCSQHKDATEYVVKKIDTDQEMAYIVDYSEDTPWGMWSLVEGLY